MTLNLREQKRKKKYLTQALTYLINWAFKCQRVQWRTKTVKILWGSPARKNELQKLVHNIEFQKNLFENQRICDFIRIFLFVFSQLQQWSINNNNCRYRFFPYVSPRGLQVSRPSANASHHKYTGTKEKNLNLHVHTHTEGTPRLNPTQES